MRTVKYSNTKGLRNDVSLERFEQQDLALANNVDLDETGKVARRMGTMLLMSGVMHSLFGFSDTAYVVIGGVLNSLQQDLTATPIVAVAGPRVAYVGINQNVHWSDGVASGILFNTTNIPWGIAVPSVITATETTGDMREGRYLITMTYLRSSGEESGAPRCSEITLAANGGLRFTGLPVSTDPFVVAKRIYITACNGELPYLSATLTNSISNLTITTLPEQSMALRTQFMGPAQAGQVVGYFAGRAYVAKGQYLWYSQPHEYGLFDLRTGYVGFDADVQTFAQCSNGVYVGTKRATYWLDGTDPTQWVRKQVAGFGTVLGSVCRIRNDLVGEDDGGKPGPVMGWMGKQGFCIGLDGGQMLNVTGGRFIPPVGSEGASLFKIRGGTPQVVTTIFS